MQYIVQNVQWLRQVPVAMPPMRVAAWLKAHTPIRQVHNRDGHKGGRKQHVIDCPLIRLG